MFLNQQRAFASATPLLAKASELEAAAIILLIFALAKDFRVRLHHIKEPKSFISLG